MIAEGATDEEVSIYRQPDPVDPEASRERRREPAQKGVRIRLARWMFSISETCYRYQAKLSSENAKIADWLIRLTHNQWNWGFGLCFLHLRSVKDFA